MLKRAFRFLYRVLIDDEDNPPPPPLQQQQNEPAPDAWRERLDRIERLENLLLAHATAQLELRIPVESTSNPVNSQGLSSAIDIVLANPLNDSQAFQVSKVDRTSQHPRSLQPLHPNHPFLKLVLVLLMLW
jgi:hypothetical protein